MSPVRFAVYSMCLVAAVLAARSDWPAAPALPVQSVWAEMESDAECERRLDLIAQRLTRQIEVKDRLVGELLAGRTTLACAAEQFLAMGRHDPVWMAVIRRDYPGRTDAERAARNVIAYATSGLPEDGPARSAEVLARLEAEFLVLAGQSLADGPPSD